MKRKNPESVVADKNVQAMPSSILEETIEKKLEDIATRSEEHTSELQSP
jgi:hypothetical protein